jgi:hypothetical protein
VLPRFINTFADLSCDQKGGAELCKNPEFLDASLKYAESFFAAAQVISMLPWWTRPFFAPFIVRPKRKQSAICEKWAVPVIERRLQEGDAQVRTNRFAC